MVPFTSTAAHGSIQASAKQVSCQPPSPTGHNRTEQQAGESRSSRRSVLLLGFASASSLQQPASATPYKEAENIQYGLSNGNIRPCPGGYNPNCVSTASLNDLYSPVWRSSLTSIATSAQVLDSAVMQSSDKAQIVIKRSMPNAEYLEYEVPGLFGRDFMEFLIKTDKGAGGAGEENSEGAIVLYRSIAGNVKYLYPFQTAISDFGAQRKRLEAIRQTLGWRKLGCDLKECFE